VYRTLLAAGPFQQLGIDAKHLGKVLPLGSRPCSRGGETIEVHDDTGIIDDDDRASNAVQQGEIRQDPRHESGGG